MIDGKAELNKEVANAQEVASEKKAWIKPAVAVESVADVTKASPVGFGKDGAACHS